jgi:rod shape-determining protein MreC
MLLSRRARELSLSVLLFAVPVVLLYGNVGQPSALNFVDRLVLRISSGLQRTMVAGVGVVVNVWDHHIWLRDLEHKNETLRHRNLELRENNEILKAWAAQGRARERELGFTITPPLHTFAADVVARGVSPFYQVLKIRLRDDAVRIRPGQAVAVPAGVVGRVMRVYGRYADVLATDDVQSRVEVVVRRTGSRGALRGKGRGGRLHGRVEYLSPRDEVRVGDVLVTSGMGGRYPRDLVVGRITGVSRRVKGRYQVVNVQAIVSAARQTTVYLATTRPTRSVGSPTARRVKKKAGP